MFPEGTLWDRIVSVSAEALASGTLQPIDTHASTVIDGGVPFAIRQVVHMPAKPMPLAAAAPDVDHNPFLPYDADLYVGDASETHACVLNKYNVVPHHLLVVTKRFEPQESRLSRADFWAAWRCLHEFDALAFYNSGTVAGASQPHKHLQVIPLPVGRQPPAVPIESLLDLRARDTGHVFQADEIPFAHAAVSWMPDLARAAERATAATEAWYHEMLDMLAIQRLSTPHGRLSKPYNLLITNRWMMMIPRRLECFDGLSLNALAFAGALLVKNQQQRMHLEAVGPLTAPRSVAEPL